MSKLCKDCQFVIDQGLHAKCGAPQNRIPDLTGFEPINLRMTYCASHRKDGWLYSRVYPPTCGEAGRWFEAKEENE